MPKSIFLLKSMEGSTLGFHLNGSHDFYTSTDFLELTFPRNLLSSAGFGQGCEAEGLWKSRAFAELGASAAERGCPESCRV